VNGISHTLKALHRGETSLAGQLLAAADRHHTDHEFHHLATDLARWSRRHADLLADAGEHHGLRLRGSVTRPRPGVLTTLREKTAEAVGRRTAPGLLLLGDLRGLYLAASANSLCWEMLAQAAQAAKDDSLLDLATTCHPQTLRQIRWANTMIKNLSPQILTSL
jgi:hypothetical protein